jgi:hypothetical protein
MFAVGRLLRCFGIVLVQPEPAVSDEVLPEYQPFIDDLEKEYENYATRDLHGILIVTGDRQGYRQLYDWKGNLLESEIQSRYSDLLNAHYEKYRRAILKSQRPTGSAELRKIIRHINGQGSWDIYFHALHYITQDAVYYSLSKLTPRIHEVNRFFIDFFNSESGIQYEHQKVFNFGYTLRCPYFRGALMSYMSNNLDALERSPMFVLFMAPLKLTPFGEERLPEIISLFADGMREYENEHGITIARDCYLKPHKMNERKLEKIIHGTTRDCENALRRQNSLPAVGEGWLQETILLKC